MARLAALIPKPRVNLVRYHVVFAPNSPHRAAVTPARRGRKQPDSKPDKTPAQQRAAMTWAQRLKRVFNIDKLAGKPIYRLHPCSLPATQAS